MIVTRFEREVVEEEEERPPNWAERAVLFVGEWVPGLFRPGVLIAAVFAAVIGLVVMGLCVFMFALGAVIIAFPIGGAGLLIYAHAVAFVLTGQVNLLHEALSELEGKKWLPFLTLVVAPIAGFVIWLQMIQD